MRRFGQLVNRTNIQHSIEECDRLRSDALQSKDVEDAGWKLFEQFLVKTTCARGGELANLGGEILAYARQRTELSLVHRRHGVAPRVDRVRRGSVRPDLERVLTLDFQQVGDFSKYSRDLAVIHESIRGVRW